MFPFYNWLREHFFVVNGFVKIRFICCSTLQILMFISAVRVQSDIDKMKYM
jgi:hypothetical protein